MRPAPVLALAVVALLPAIAAGQAGYPSAAASKAQPASPRPGFLKEVGFDQMLDAQVPLDVPLRDEAGREVRLGDYLGEKPVVLNLVYYRCPMLCTVVLNGLSASLKALEMTVGEEFDVVTLSIDPTETPELAARKKAAYLRRYGRASAARGWHFLTGPEESIRRVADAVGFRYRYDSASQQYAHAAGIVVLTPKGRISRYFYGVDYPNRDLKLALVEASAGKVGSPIDRLLLLCYHYDPATGKYNFAVMGALRALCVVTLLVLGSYLLVMIRRDRRAWAAVGAAGGSPTRTDGD